MRKVWCFSPGNGGRNNCNGLPTTTNTKTAGAPVWNSQITIILSTHCHHRAPIMIVITQPDMSSASRSLPFATMAYLKRRETILPGVWHEFTWKQRKKHVFSPFRWVAKRLSGASCGAIVRFLKTKCQILENGTQCANITFSGLIFCCDSVWKLDFTSLFLKWFESKQIPVNYK